MRNVLSIFLTVLLTITCQPSYAITYFFNEPHRFDAYPFGVSGTISTDGSFGTQATLEFVTDWQITVATPDNVDGIASELLTPLNSSLALQLNGYPGIVATPDALTFFPRFNAGGPFTELEWSTANDETVFKLSNRSTFQDGLGAVFSIVDRSEPDGVLGVGLDDLPFASVPEPHSTLIMAICTAMLLPLRNRRRRTNG